MNRRRLNAAWQGLVLAVLIGLLAWHTISWHDSGEHGEIFDAIGDNVWDTAKGCAYYVGLMAAAGLLLGLFMEKLTDFFGYEVERIEHFEESEEADGGEAGKAGDQMP
jgi:hypothetical protein